MNVPDPQNTVLGKAHELSMRPHKTDPHHAGHVTTKHLKRHPIVDTDN